ncbi:tRNA (adenosine(37)-N6)-threonylcarbamoyltransferase complex transferase subunit TsaD [archaeon]|nr:tRNA (adenosine(37)-N6)-threonylcarbamoyltransferase complex transferase subunit TsaD [archaeon]
MCLGIESTAHTFGCGIVSFDGEILANERAVYTSQEGMIPDVVREHHKTHADKVINDALQKSEISWKEISLIRFSQGPGLAPSLVVGKDKAIELAKKHNKPLIGINHCVAHLTIGNLVTGFKDPVYLYVSGVNTQVIALENKKFRVFGETLDIGLGNALDKFGRTANLGFPAGPKIEELAKKGKYIEFPYSVKGMDVSFSGIMTKAQQLIKKEKVEDLCYSFQETSFSMLCEIAERALAYTNKKELLLIGGVAANKRLNEMLNLMCEARNVEYKPVPIQYTGDQGAMIAWQGILEFKAGRKDNLNVDIKPHERTDDVEVIW